MTTTQIADLVGLTEIAERCNVSKNVASGWTRKHTFPEIKLKLAMGPMWDWNEVQAHLYGTVKVTVTDETGKLSLTIKPQDCPTCADGTKQTPQPGTLRLRWTEERGCYLSYEWSHKACRGWGEHAFSPSILTKEDK